MDRYRLSKGEFLIGIISLLLGGVIIYAYMNNQISDGKKVTARIIDNCIAGLTTMNNQIANQQKAFNELAICTVINNEGCDREESAKKLEQIRHERISLEYKIQEVSNEAQSIINDLK